MISQAMAENKGLVTIAYEDGRVVISPAPSDTPDLADSSLQQRAISRIAFQETKRQINIETITRHAAVELENESEVGPSRPDSDWISRFFRTAEDITTEEMQLLWGKVLAGEVKRPGSFSLRTLDLLKGITKSEAEVFAKACNVAMVSGNKAFVPNPDRGKFLAEKFGLAFTDWLLLEECGLVVPDLTCSLGSPDGSARTVFTCGRSCLLIDQPAGLLLKLNVIFFSQIGRQLLELVDKCPADPDYIKKVASFFKREGVEIKSGRVVGWDGDTPNCEGLQSVFDGTPP